jgi:hypothetical protein
MESTPSQTQADRREVLIARADEELAHAHELITSADEQIARLHARLSKLERDEAARSRHRRMSRLWRGFTSVVLAAVICLAAITWRSPYGEAARLILAKSLVGMAPRVAAVLLPAPNQPALAKSAASHEMYLELARQADSFVGQPLSFAGKVMQSVQNGESNVLRINVTAGNDNSWRDSIYVDYRPPALTGQDRIAEGELVSVRGTFIGISSYQSVLGEESQAPSVVACAIRPGLGNIAACPGDPEQAPANSGN